MVTDVSPLAGVHRVTLFSLPLVDDVSMLDVAHLRLVDLAHLATLGGDGTYQRMQSIMLERLPVLVDCGMAENVPKVVIAECRSIFKYDDLKMAEDVLLYKCNIADVSCFRTVRRVT